MITKMCCSLCHQKNVHLSSFHTFRGVLCVDSERSQLVGNAVAQTRTVGCDAGTTDVVHVELKRRLCNTQSTNIHEAKCIKSTD